MEHALGIYIGGGYATGTEFHPHRDSLPPLGDDRDHRGIAFRPGNYHMQTKYLDMSDHGAILFASIGCASAGG
jgi:hypothetical protein